MIWMSLINRFRCKVLLIRKKNQVLKIKILQRKVLNWSKVPRKQNLLWNKVQRRLILLKRDQRSKVQRKLNLQRNQVISLKAAVVVVAVPLLLHHHLLLIIRQLEISLLWKFKQLKLGIFWLMRSKQRNKLEKKNKNKSIRKRRSNAKKKNGKRKRKKFQIMVNSQMRKKLNLPT